MGKRNFTKTIPAIFTLTGILFASAVADAAAYYNVGAWFKTQYSRLAFTSSAQSIYAGNCSGAVTVVNKNPFGTTKNVTSNLTVNLSGPGTLTFYSDSACTIAITSVTIPSGSSSANFYFIDTAVESATITASATSYKSGTQTETLSTSAVFNNFKLAGNGPTFNVTGTVTINGNLDFVSPTWNAFIYGGTFAVGGNLTSTGSGGFRGSSVVKLTGNASGQTVSTPSGGCFPNLTIQAGTNPVTFGSAVTVVGNYTVTSMGTFTSTGSTFTMAPQFSANYSIQTGSETYNNVYLVGNGSTISLGGSTMNIAGSFTLDGATYGGAINSGTLKVGGDVSAIGSATVPGSAVVQLTGNASGQTISTSTLGGLPSVTISAGANTVTLSGTVTVRGSFIVSSVGSLVTTGSTLALLGASGSSNTVTPGTWTYNNVTFGGYYPTYNLGGSTMTIAGDLTYANSGSTNLNAGTLSVSGNFTAQAGSFYNGSIAVQLVGTADQTLSSAATNMPSGAVTINKSSGSVYLASNYSQPASTWSLTAGTLYMSGYNLSINGLSLNGNTIHRKNNGATSAAGVLTVNGTSYGNGSYLGGSVAD